MSTCGLHAGTGTLDLDAWPWAQCLGRSSGHSSLVSQWAIQPANTHRAPTMSQKCLGARDAYPPPGNQVVTINAKRGIVCRHLVPRAKKGMSWTHHQGAASPQPSPPSSPGVQVHTAMAFCQEQRPRAMPVLIQGDARGPQKGVQEPCVPPLPQPSTTSSPTPEPDPRAGPGGGRAGRPSLKA